ncbi:MAG TPA: hypothetical protein VE779_08130 [Candidatus Angelobacter sp.]|nr:hypothetical protein [Candidatus Angelobacter sp.]
MNVKSLATAAKKYGTNASAGSANYASGVQSNTTWMQNTEAAASTWAAGVSAAASNGTFAKGVSKAGQSTWQAGAVQKGQARFQSAVSTPQAQTNWQNGFQPYAQVLQGITVPPKGVRGSPGNYQIVQTIGTALHTAKVNNG